MASSFENITRRLDINPAAVDTTYDKSRSVSRAIKKIPYTFTIPETAFNLGSLGLFEKGALLGQVNYTAPYAFKILSPLHLYSRVDSTVTGPLITIRYRVGGVVTRYRLLSDETGHNTYMTRRQKVYAPAYSNQLIQPNFTIEFWLSDVPAVLFNVSLETVAITNRLLIPPSIDDLDDNFTGTYYDRATLALAMPEALPVQYVDESAWLTN